MRLMKVSFKPGSILCTVLLLASFAAAQTYTVRAITLPGFEGAGLGINAQGNIVGQLFANGENFGLIWSPAQGTSVLPAIPGGYSSYATGINSENVVAGFATFNSTGVTHAARWTNGVVRDLGTLPGGTVSLANGINSAGQIAGASNSPDLPYHAVIWSASTGIQDLGVLQGGYYSLGTAINRSGQVVGYSVTVSEKELAFVWSKAKGMQDLGSLPNGGAARANAINDLGQIVGYSTCGYSCFHAAMWSTTVGSLQDLGTLPGSTGSVALGINNSGQVVGSTYTLDHAFVWSEAAGMQDLNALIPPDSGWTLVTASAINDKGEIVGQGLSCCGLGTQALLLTPVAGER